MIKKIKTDKYKTVRGGSSKMLKIYCGKCRFFLCEYQKDGAGNLRRMYLDRIIKPLISLDKKDLSCGNGHIIGVKIIYKKENRLAFRLISGSFVKEIIKF